MPLVDVLPIWPISLVLIWHYLFLLNILSYLRSIFSHLPRFSSWFLYFVIYRKLSFIKVNVRSKEDIRIAGLCRQASYMECKLDSIVLRCDQLKLLLLYFVPTKGCHSNVFRQVNPAISSKNYRKYPWMQEESWKVGGYQLVSGG